MNLDHVSDHVPEPPVFSDIMSVLQWDGGLGAVDPGTDIADVFRDLTVLPHVISFDGTLDGFRAQVWATSELWGDLLHAWDVLEVLGDWALFHALHIGQRGVWLSWNGNGGVVFDPEKPPRSSTGGTREDSGHRYHMVRYWCERWPGEAMDMTHSHVLHTLAGWLVQQ